MAKDAFCFRKSNRPLRKPAFFSRPFRSFRLPFPQRIFISSSGKSVPVVMCVYNRIDRFERTCRLLSRQTVPPELYVWNNRHEERAALRRLARKNWGFRIRVRHSRNNIGGWGRFRLARHLAGKGFSHVIFIDDDVEFDSDMIERLSLAAELKTISSFWAFRFKRDSIYTDRIPARSGEKIHYCGTGGMIADASIFLNKNFFSFSPNARWVEDLWLSYFAQHVLGWKLKKSEVDFKIIRDGRGLWLTANPQKIALLDDLRQQGWNV